MKNHVVSGCLGLGALLLTGCGTQGQADPGDFPNETITIYVPFSAGGPTDTMARVMATHFEEDLGETVVVENRPGASGGLGIQALISEPADGHSIAVLGLPSGATNPMLEDLGYESDDYRMIAGVIENASMLAVGANSELDDGEAFFDHAKANPDSLRVAVNGITTSHAMEIMRLNEEYDIELTAVPYEGTSESMAALLGGNVDAAFLPTSIELMSNVDSGDFTPIAFGTPERQDYLPEVPTLNELGFEGIDQSLSTFGFVAHADTPDEVISTIENVVESGLQDEDIIQTLDPRFIPQEFVDAEAFEARQHDAIEAFSSVVDELSD